MSTADGPSKLSAGQRGQLANAELLPLRGLRRALLDALEAVERGDRKPAEATLKRALTKADGTS